MSGVFAFEAICATLPPALLGAARLPLAALRPVDFARDVGPAPVERFRLAWLRLALPFARLPFELPRRDREEAFVLDEALRLELRLLPERLLDDFVPWAIFPSLSFRFLAVTVHSRDRPNLIVLPLRARSHAPTPLLKRDLHAPTLFQRRCSAGWIKRSGKPLAPR